MASRRILPFIIIFLTGYNFGVPGYRVFVAFQPLHGVYLDNILIAGYLIAAGVPKGFRTRSNTVVFVGMIFLLALLGILSSALNPTRPEDIGQALRLVLLAAYTFHAVEWTRFSGDTFVLRAFLIGLGIGGAINIIVSFWQPYLRLGYLPALYARNGAGGPLGLAVTLGAWLYLMHRGPADKIVAIAVSAIGILAAFISFSKTSMLVAACGVVAWLFVLGRSATKRGWRIGALAFIALLVSGGLYLRNTEQGQDLMRGFRYSLSIKFAGAALRLNDQASTQWRYQYFWGVAEIVSKHPLTGVGTSGFYDAIIQTEPFKAGLMADEDPQARTKGGANPHNSFLFVASAHGIPGIALGAALYLAFLAILRLRLSNSGWAGRGVFGALALAYFIYGMTLPSMFNTMILYLPAAVVIGMTRMKPASQSLELETS